MNIIKRIAMWIVREQIEHARRCGYIDGYYAGKNEGFALGQVHGHNAAIEAVEQCCRDRRGIEVTEEDLERARKRWVR